MALAGIYTWLCIWFIPTKVAAMASIAISGVISLSLLYHVIVLVWSKKATDKIELAKQPLWVIRFVSPLAFLFLAWYPLYFFFSLSLPSIYTAIAENSSVITLSVSKRYSTNKNSVRKKEKFWLAFHGYYGSIRIERDLYESLQSKNLIEASVLKSPLGIYIVSIN
jgi:hypothetical protein